jgi:transposase
MIPVPSGVKVWLATGHTDMRKGFPGLSLMVQETLKSDPHSGHLFCFRGRQGGLIKVIWHDGQGACLFTKKLERGRFICVSGRRHGGDYAGAARLSARRHRLANAAKNLASELRWIVEKAGKVGANMIPSRHDRCG